MAKKVSPMTDIKSLPKWQKYTIIAILFALALAFTMSGAMVAVINYVTKKGGEPMGRIDGTEIEYEDFQKYYVFYSTVYRAAGRQMPEAKQLLFSKMPVKSPLDQIQTYMDTYYIDYIAQEVKQEKKDATTDDRDVYDDIYNKLAWNHLLLLKLAEDEDISVSDKTVHEIARQVILGPPNKPVIQPAASRENNNANANDANNLKAPTSAEGADLTAGWNEELTKREAMYASSLESLFTQNQRYNMDPDDFEKIIEECLIIKRYMDNAIASNINVTRQDVLENINSFKTEMLLEYLRVKSDNPEVLKRAKEKLSDELAMLALKRNVWESGTLMSGKEIFPDPLEKIYNLKLESESDKFEDPAYIIKVIASEYNNITSSVIVPEEIVEQFYKHYKSVFFRNDRSEADIEKQIDEEKKELIKQHANEIKPVKPDANDDNVKKEYEPAEGWEEWRKNRLDELSYKPYEEVKMEAEKLAHEMATPKFAATAIKKLKEEIKNRIEKNRNVHDEEKRNKEEIFHTMKELEDVLFGNDIKKGALDLFSGFKKFVNNEIEAIRRKCSLNYDKDETSVLHEIKVKVINDAFIKAWNNIDEKKKNILMELKFSENPYANEENAIADAQKQLSEIETEIENLRDNKQFESFKRLSLLEKRQEIASKRLELLKNMRKELMLAMNKLKEAFREAILMSGSFGNDFNVSKGFLDAYFDGFENQIAKLLNDFSIRMNINELADKISSEVQAMEVEIQRFESEVEETVNNLSKELPPEALLNIKISDFPYRDLGLKVHELKLSKVYNGTSIKGMWGAGISPYEYISAMTVEEMKKDPWIKQNMPYLLNASKWDFKTNTAAGTKFADILNELKVGEYSDPIGVMGVGVYMIYLEAKDENQEPDFEDVKEELIQDYIDQNVSEIANKLALEIRSEILKNIQEIIDANSDEVLEIAEKFIKDGQELTKIKADFNKADPASINMMKRKSAEFAFKNAAQKYGLELKRTTDYVNINSDIEDIAYDNTSDRNFLLDCMKIAPYFELSKIAKEIRPDKERDTKTNASYVFARVLDTRESTIIGAKIDPSDLIDDEVELLYKNKWARKVIANKKITDLTKRNTLVKMLNEKGMKTTVYSEKLSDATSRKR